MDSHDEKLFDFMVTMRYKDSYIRQHFKMTSEQFYWAKVAHQERKMEFQRQVEKGTEALKDMWIRINDLIMYLRTDNDVERRANYRKELKILEATYAAANIMNGPIELKLHGSTEQTVGSASIQQSTRTKKVS
jgi:hypothetical protein